MKASLNWLKRYVEIREEARVVANDLTMFGLNVEALKSLGADYSGVVFGRVLECAKHPQADRLSVCTVDTGGKRPLNIVCGATNVRAGMGVAVAVAGAVLAGGFRIKKTRLRGEISEGMICSEKELGIGADEQGILELDLTLGPGVSLDGKLGGGDTIFDVEVTPNRPDLLSHIGIAREIAALYRRTLQAPQRMALRHENGFRIEMEDQGDCPRYSAAFIDDVRIAPSPDWLQELLTGVGLKPRNNIVDITNFVLLELGQPLHAFDRDRMGRDAIFVRRGRSDERILTLDGVDRDLGEDVLLITDGVTPIGVAGVMGGRATEVTSETKRVLLESAYFDPRSIRRSRRCLKLDTEASYRFERGADPGVTVAALERACRLIADTGAGRPAEIYADALAAADLVVPRTLAMRTRQANRVMGTMLAVDDLVELLSRLGLKTFFAGEQVTVSVPTFRRDLREEIDLIEETARLYGYDNIGREEERHGVICAEISPFDRRNEELCDRLAARGFAEITTSSFMDPGDPERLQWRAEDSRSRPVKLENPLTAAQSAMRTSLLPGMLRVAGRNFAAGLEGIRIFELDKVFLQRSEGEGLPEEQYHLCAVFSGRSGPLQWFEKQRDFDFFDMKGEVESTLEYLGVQAETGTTHRVRDDECCYNWLYKNKIVASWGGIPFHIAARFDVPAPVYFFDILLDAFPPGWAGRVVSGRISQFPAVKRDLSVLAPERVGWSDIRTVVRKNAKHLESVTLFDYYQDDQLGHGLKSYAFRMIFRSHEGTLEDAQIDTVIGAVLDGLQEELQVALRSE